jgi:hypothetical protein
MLLASSRKNTSHRKARKEKTQQNAKTGKKTERRKLRQTLEGKEPRTNGLHLQNGIPLTTNASI